jgi:hypothetical protein
MGVPKDRRRFGFDLAPQDTSVDVRLKCKGKKIVSANKEVNVVEWLNGGLGG